jgi:hypothetical protein
VPDVEITPQQYNARPPEPFESFHTRVRAREPEAHVYEIVRIVTALITFRARGIGSEHAPIGPGGSRRSSRSHAVA